MQHILKTSPSYRMKHQVVDLVLFSSCTKRKISLRWQVRHERRHEGLSSITSLSSPICGSTNSTTNCTHTTSKSCVSRERNCKWQDLWYIFLKQTYLFTVETTESKMTLLFEWYSVFIPILLSPEQAHALTSLHYGRDNNPIFDDGSLQIKIYWSSSKWWCNNVTKYRIIFSVNYECTALKSRLPETHF